MKKQHSKKILILRIILFIIFMFFGIAKLLVSPEDTVQIFGKIGGSTAQYFTGAYQIISAILVIIPTTAFLGALLIAVSMAIAVILHFTIIGFEGPLAVLTIFAFILFLIALYVMKKSRKSLFK